MLGKSFGMGVLLIEKLVATVFFGLAVIVLLVLYFRGVTDPAPQLFAGELREDPRDRVALLLIGLIPSVSRSTLLSLSLASCAYFVLEAIEARGLLLNRLWVEWLILIEAGGFLPYEVYELAHQLTWLNLSSFIANVLILTYLVRRMLLGARKQHRKNLPNSRTNLQA